MKNKYSSLISVDWRKCIDKNGGNLKHISLPPQLKINVSSSCGIQICPQTVFLIVWLFIWSLKSLILQK